MDSIRGVMAKILEFRPKIKKEFKRELKREIVKSDLQQRMDEVERSQNMKAAFEGLLAQVLHDRSKDDVEDGKLAIRSAVEILESTDAVRLRFALPGFDKEQVQILFRKNILRVNVFGKALENEDRLLFSQSLPIPSLVDPHGAAAQWEDGMLVVDFPKLRDDDSSHGIEIPIP